MKRFCIILVIGSTISIESRAKEGEQSALCSCGDQRKCCFGGGVTWCCNKDERCVDTARGCSKGGTTTKAPEVNDIRKVLEETEALRKKQQVCSSAGCKEASIPVPVRNQDQSDLQKRDSNDPWEIQSAGVWCSAYGWIDGHLFAVMGNWVGNCQGALNKARQCYANRVTQVWCPNGFIMCPAPVLICQ